MPRLRGTKYLTCFYCGKRSNTKFDGSTHDFLCLFCDATNYLDEVSPRGGKSTNKELLTDG